MESHKKYNDTASAQNIKPPGTQDNVNVISNSTTSVSAPKTAAPKAPATGLASLPSTSVFRAVNFELYVKPNKVAMICGVVAFSSCVAYIAYMNLKDDSNQKTYVTLDLDGRTSVRPKTSRWD